MFAAEGLRLERLILAPGDPQELLQVPLVRPKSPRQRGSGQQGAVCQRRELPALWAAGESGSEGPWHCHRGGARAPERLASSRPQGLDPSPMAVGGQLTGPLTQLSPSSRHGHGQPAPSRALALGELCLPCAPGPGRPSGSALAQGPAPDRPAQSLCSLLDHPGEEPCLDPPGQSWPNGLSTEVGRAWPQTQPPSSSPGR